jgi:F-type H+-transporting ATPase subunit delta
MIVGSIARRYAKALFGLALEQGRVEAWSDALITLQEAIDGSADLQDVLENPIYSKEQRRAVVAQLAQALRLDGDPASLLALLADRNRLGYLSAIVQTFRELSDTQLGRIRAKVTSAAPIDDASANAMALRLAGAVNARVIVERQVDPALLGGVVAQVGSLVFDGSVRTQLEDLRRQLKS